MTILLYTIGFILIFGGLACLVFSICATYVPRGSIFKEPQTDQGKEKYVNILYGIGIGSVIIGSFYFASLLTFNII